jgi:hypothetical protein
VGRSLALTVDCIAIFNLIGFALINTLALLGLL